MVKIALFQNVVIYGYLPTKFSSSIFTHELLWKIELSSLATIDLFHTLLLLAIPFVSFDLLPCFYPPSDIMRLSCSVRQLL